MVRPIFVSVVTDTLAVLQLQFNFSGMIPTSLPEYNRTVVLRMPSVEPVLTVDLLHPPRCLHWKWRVFLLKSSVWSLLVE